MSQSNIEKLALIRQIELNNNPKNINRTFDVKHLKSIHAYLFQDSQKERNSGLFRPEKNDVHSKNREDTYSVRKPFFYEPLPNDNKVDNIIKQADEKLTLSKSPNEKVNILSNLYAELDYQHPFVEGNSRTIRTFLQHIAQKHDITLDWQSMVQNKDEFYRARDFEIAKRNDEIKPINDIEEYMLEEAKRYNTKNYIASQIAMHNGRYLHQIIKDCCDYPNKELFEKLDNIQIKKDYPTISTQDIYKIELYKNYLLEKYQSPASQQLALALEQLHSQLPNIATGKIALPDLPNLKSKEDRER